MQKSRTEANMNVLSMPPLSLGERFEDAYEVVLILDDREQFANQGSVNLMFREICYAVLELVIVSS